MNSKIRFYKTIYSVAWLAIIFTMIVMITLLFLAGPKAAGILILYYSPTWVPVLIFGILAIKHSTKLIDLYEKNI